jgi:hypothetical protein
VPSHRTTTASRYRRRTDTWLFDQGDLKNVKIIFKLFETTQVYQSGMTTFFALLGVAGLAYRVFVKGETIFVKNPNWKMRGLSCLAMGMALIALSVFILIASYVHHLPVPGINWAMLVLGGSIIVLGVRVMKRSPAA